MISLSDRGNKFSCEVKTYEFPNAKDDLDANWLIICIKAEQEVEGSWTACGPYLRTHELVSLSKWLKSLQVEMLPSRIEFMEGELAFEFSGDMKFVVMLDFNFHPRSAVYDYSSDREFPLYFSIDENTITELICSVEKAIRVFPKR
ncbi:hypothetical protein EJD88_18370 [Pseudomonas sp. PB105]|jgi:hypothetical protein|uniref:WapI family immunity protein n=1 Tax=unclassified Pseudomonas TaxID=196821 RepID=UPI00131C2799|nr:MULTISPECIES: hypothetical protein [unclassified Pseudomonas]KAE9651716.1 hypothetical protein EJD88_18370 [Pseudomonas sp. PB105]MCM2360524.1 hypothetical protein [Pseudomonas sp. SR18]MVW97924.1 hypothetical protein [Pseudomonas sp. PB100]